MTDATDDYFEWLFSDKGSAEHARQMQQAQAKERARWHASRFCRAADSHDRRIPFETRVEVLQRANEHCERCGRFIASGFSPGLDLHHLTYERAYGDELPDDLMVLCRDCHEGEHA